MSERRGFLVSPDALGWNIHREPGHHYVESHFYRDDAVRKARVLAHGNPVYVLDKATRTVFVDTAPTGETRSATDPSSPHA